MDANKEPEPKEITLADPSVLPTPNELARMNVQITEDVLRCRVPGVARGQWPDSVLNTYFCRHILVSTQIACSDIEQAYNMFDFVRFIKEYPQMQEECRQAWISGDYRTLIRIEQIRVRIPRPEPEIPPAIRACVEKAWTRKFLGSTHRLLIKNIDDMDKARRDAASKSDDRYMNHVSIIQSSGIGKSRMVDEVAKHYFTIPFNLRTSDETKFGAYPPPDPAMRDLLVGEGLRASDKTEEPALNRYHLILGTVFSCANEALGKLPRYNTLPELAQAWYDYLKGGERTKMYGRVAKQMKNINLNGRKPVDYSKFRLEQLVQTVNDHSSSSATAPGIKVLMDFDEAHVLAGKLATGKQARSSLDILVDALNELRHEPLFALLISTQLRLSYVAPSATFVSSARGSPVFRVGHPPVTETSFDCFGGHKIIPKYLDAETVSDVVYMSLFGRPLWSSMLLEYIQPVLDKVTTASDLAEREHLQFESDSRRQRKCLDILTLARTKLLFCSKVDLPRDEYRYAARSAVLDVCIMLAFESRRVEAHKREVELISSHMRTLFSVPRTRDFLYSGYPSEPILAEAAARQLHHWRTTEPRLPDPAVAILVENLKDDLLSPTELGEVTARLILTQAHDRAVVTEYMHKWEDGYSGTPHFSSPVSATTFLRKLFTQHIADELLASCPDNQPGGKTLGEVLSDAAINFTHFIQWVDSQVCMVEACAAAFARSAAIISSTGASGYHLIIPYLENRKLSVSPDNMSGFIIQVNTGMSTGTRPACELRAEHINFFPSKENRKRAYIMMIMELRLRPLSPLLRPAPHDGPQSDKAVNMRNRLLETRQAGDARARMPPRPVERHPRYSIYVAGCSPSVYKVIDERTRKLYAQILDAGGLLAQHPRQDEYSLATVRQQKPFLSVGEHSFHWWHSTMLNPTGGTGEIMPPDPAQPLRPEREDWESGYWVGLDNEEDYLAALCAVVTRDEAGGDNEDIVGAEQTDVEI